MYTAILSAKSEKDFNDILEFSKKKNFKTRILKEDDFENQFFQKANESALTDWLTPEEDEAWKDL